MLRFILVDKSFLLAFIVVAMAPKMMKAKVNDVVPTEQEYERADAIIAAASNAQLHSISNAMNHSLKNNGDAVCQLSEGDLRKKFIKNFVVIQQRAKLTQKKMLSSRVVEEGTAKMTDTVPWNKHKIYKELGFYKGDLFMGILPKKPCRLSGSMHEEAVEYDIPLSWQRVTLADLQQLTQRNESEAKADDTKMLDEIIAGIKDTANPSSSSASAVSVKEDVKKP